MALSSIAADAPHRMMAAYCVAKAGIDMLVRVAAEQGVAVIVSVATGTFAVALATFFAFGLSNLTAGISLSIVIQSTTDDVFRGRVGSLYMSGFLLGGSIGALTIGISATGSVWRKWWALSESSSWRIRSECR